MLAAGAAQARTAGRATWPVRWTVAADAAATPPGPPATIVVLEPSSLGVTITGAYMENAVTSGAAMDAVGAPIDLARFIQMQRTFSSLSLPGSRPDGLPLSRGYLTSGFGMRLNPLGGGFRMHSGIDLAAPAGTPVVASGGGTVRAANWRGGYGLFVEIDHGGGLQSRYGHMSRLNVFPGQHLKGGEVIGFVGSTGNSTGPHLHYETLEAGRAVNPLHRH